MEYILHNTIDFKKGDRVVHLDDIILMAVYLIAGALLSGSYMVYACTQ